MSEATCQAEGIMIGDGISSLNNMVVDIFENAVLDLTSGYLVYNNVT